MDRNEIRKEIKRLEGMLVGSQRRRTKKVADTVIADDGVRLKLRKGERITIIVGKKPH